MCAWLLHVNPTTTTWIMGIVAVLAVATWFIPKKAKPPRTS